MMISQFCCNSFPRSACNFSKYSLESHCRLDTKIFKVWARSGSTLKAWLRLKNFGLNPPLARIMDTSIDSKLTFDSLQMKLGSLNIRCLSTPCHTKGHICYLITSPGQTPVVFTGQSLLGSNYFCSNDFNWAVVLAQELSVGLQTQRALVQFSAQAENFSDFTHILLSVFSLFRQHFPWASGFYSLYLSLSFLLSPSFFSCETYFGSNRFFFHFGLSPASY